MATRKALVTGASAGIGRAFARELAEQGYDLIVTARRTQLLEELAEDLRSRTGVTVDVHTADLTRPAELSGLCDRAASEKDLTLLVNNAGFGAYQSFIELDPRTAQDLVAVHVVATVQLSRAVLPAMVEKDDGAIINVASLMAFSGMLPAPPLPYRATYAGAKAFLITFSRTLAGELMGTQVRVMVCCPGTTESQFHEVQDMDMTHAPKMMSAEDVVRGALAGLELGEVICIPGLEDDSLLQQMLQAELIVMGNAGGPDSPGTLATRYSNA